MQNINYTTTNTNSQNNKLRAFVIQDENPDNPFWDWDTGVTFLVDKSSRNFGGLASSNAPESEHSEDWAFVFPLYGFVHSMQSISLKPLGCQWDSGQIGFVGITKSDLDGCFGKSLTEAEAIKSISALISNINYYFTGDVYGFKIEEEIDNEWIVVDERWGFYGQETAQTEAEQMLEFYAKPKPQK
jgi:hypothetical protein